MCTRGVGAGATGFVGSALVRRLTALGYPVRVLTREVASAQRKVRSGGGVTLVSPAQWEAAIKGCGAVVNLSGEPISTRWTPTIKREIMNSRVNTTNRLAVRACVRLCGLLTLAVLLRSAR